MTKYFCDKCGKISEKDELHLIYPDLMSKEYIELCENCFQEYSKEMQKYIDNINKAETEREEAIKKYFVMIGEDRQ